jgi:RNA polymerase sigma-70 factor (ECF subfamily)
MTQALTTETVVEPDLIIPFGAASVPTPSFEDLVTRYQAELYRFALRLTENRTDADDLYQETLLKAFRAFDRLDGAANHRAWLYRIASNTFLSNRRRAVREQPLDAAIEDGVPEAQIDHAARLDAEDLLREVAAFVNALPPKQRVALVLRKHHGMGYDEIATVLSSSVAAARASVHEALRKLRDRFADRLDDPFAPPNGQGAASEGVREFASVDRKEPVMNLNH